MIANLYRYPKLSGSLVVVVLVSFGVFTWAVYKNIAIGLQASGSGTSGGADKMAWVWLFASLATLVAATSGNFWSCHRPLSSSRSGIPRATRRPTRVE
jgi:hypothetical protein